MNYTKPQVAVLGQAARVIESLTAKGATYTVPDGILPPFNSAYDLDD
ncbi:MAG: hypothetical protein WB729_05365 [Candidatus Sulfotelmatobacter sp.]